MRSAYCCWRCYGRHLAPCKLALAGCGHRWSADLCHHSEHDPLLGFVRPDLRPSRDLVSRDVISQIARLGGFFFILQVVVAISYSADNFIIARTLGAASVPEYSIPQRMFALISMMSAMLIAPLWPAYGEAISRGDNQVGPSDTVPIPIAGLRRRFLGVRHAFSRFPAPDVLVGWPPNQSAYLSVSGAGAVGGDGVLRKYTCHVHERCKYHAISNRRGNPIGIACVSTKFVLVRRYGITAVPWSTIVTYLLFNALPYAIYLLRLFSHDHFLPQTDGNGASRLLV